MRRKELPSVHLIGCKNFTEDYRAAGRGRRAKGLGNSGFGNFRVRHR